MERGEAVGPGKKFHFMARWEVNEEGELFGREGRVG